MRLLINGDRYERAAETRRMNAARKARKSRKRGKRGKLTGAAKRAFVRRMASGRRNARRSRFRAAVNPRKRKSGGAARKRTRRASPSTRRVHHRSPTVAAKRRRKRRATSGTHRRRRRHTASAPRRRRRRTHRRGGSISFRRIRGTAYVKNPGLGGIGRRLMNAGKGAAVVTLSRAGINIISRMIPLGQSAPMRAVAQLVATGAVGFGVGKFLGSAAGDLAMIAGIDALYTSVIRNLNVPVLSSALGDDVIQGYYLGPGGVGDMGDMGAYYNGGVSTLPAGGALSGYVGDDAEAALISQ